MAKQQVLMMLGFAFVAPAAMNASVEAIWANMRAMPEMAHQATLIACVAYAVVALALAGVALQGTRRRLDIRGVYGVPGGHCAAVRAGCPVALRA
jgi:hypothetical protein